MDADKLIQVFKSLDEEQSKEIAEAIFIGGSPLAAAMSTYAFTIVQ